MMYRVTWEIDLDADSVREAAQKALDIQRDPDSIATVFRVIERTAATAAQEIDLGEVIRRAPSMDQARKQRLRRK